MQILTCIAGLPRAVVDEIRSLPAARFTEDDGNRPIMRPVKPPFAFRPGMEEGYHQDLRDRIAQLNPHDEAAVILAYVNYPNSETSRFVATFFPFAIHAPLEPFDPEAGPKSTRRAALVAYVDAIEKALTKLVAKMRGVRDALSGRNFTPLLLPLGNFKSDIVRPQIAALYDALGTAPDPRTLLEIASKSIAAAHPIGLIGEGKKRTRFYEDARRLRFKSPGSNRHGMAQQGGAGHGPHCLINGRVRLGGPFDSQFHYDCEYARGNVDREYPNCHAENIAPADAQYVNIAPNDYVR
ncbi:hypothetical protein [Sphingomonas adhaesiva]|uniref:Uncharacterized protein n=1 Tax=Sphingomonas adhaesiva TaxID=28212 RepID=A0A2A4I5B3_9SPHN|nr:hypothetical protein [Sphingomonas adhaesiva]PCG13288.1 hypothetical protein COA07_15110 [Sphingomonas adhaesiva]